MMSERNVVKAILEKAGFDLDQENYKSPDPRYSGPKIFTRHKDGTYTVRRTFFYRLDLSATKIANKVAEAFQGTPLRAVIQDHFEHWAAWPSSSYWEVHFQILDSIEELGEEDG